ncbi:hypothetical protein ACFXKX_07940 [Streptomyces scopuliridis]|uniref:hypothetical protein n=1 Tax=Streptomyces scopuliridis TaxID=452529 RepID=UPI003686154E
MQNLVGSRRVRHDGAEVLYAGLHHKQLLLLGAPLPVVDAAKVISLPNFMDRTLSPVPIVVSVRPGRDVAGIGEPVAALCASAIALVIDMYRMAEILNHPRRAPPGQARRGVWQLLHDRSAGVLLDGTVTGWGPHANHV